MTDKWPHYLPLQQSRRPARVGSEFGFAKANDRAWDLRMPNSLRSCGFSGPGNLLAPPSPGCESDRPF